MLYNCQNRISYIGIIAEVRFASFLSGGFITMAVMNPPEKNWKNEHLCNGSPNKLQGFYSF